MAMPYIVGWKALYLFSKIMDTIMLYREKVRMMTRSN